MLLVEPTRDFRSTHYPEVVVTLKNLTYDSHGQLLRRINPLSRIERDFGKKFRDLDTKMVPLTQEDGSPDMDRESGKQRRGLLDPDDQNMLQALLEDFDVFQKTQLGPEYLRWAFVSVQGMSTSKGPIATADEFLSYAPPSLGAEVIETIQTQSKLSAEERTNLFSQPTGSVAAGTAKSPTTAEPVNPTAPLPDETALVTSPNS